MSPLWNANDFLAEVRRDVPKVLGAYLKGDMEALKATNTTKEMLERMGRAGYQRRPRQCMGPGIIRLTPGLTRECSV